MIVLLEYIDLSSAILQESTYIIIIIMLAGIIGLGIYIYTGGYSYSTALHMHGGII